MEQTPAATTEPAKPQGRKTGMIVLGVILIIIIAVGALYALGYLNIGGGGPTTKAVSIFENAGTSCATSTECGYNPSPQSVTVGQKIKWTNDGTLPHSVTACDSSYSPSSAACPTMNAPGLDVFDSGATSYLSGGQTFEHTFNNAGTYYYYCRVHTQMHGQVNVATA